jgi:hypothetical protein
LLGVVEEEEGFAFLPEAQRVELFGENIAQDAVRKAHSGKAAGEFTFKKNPEVLVLVLQFAADEVEDGRFIVFGTEEKRRAEIGEERKVEGRRRGAGEGDGAAGAGGEGGFEVVGENAEGDFEFLGIGAEIGFGEAGADGVGAGDGREGDKEKNDGEVARERRETTRKPEGSWERWFNHG